MKKWTILYLIALMVLPSLLFSQKIQKNISQTQTTEYVALIDLLQDGEQYEIEMISSGCFEQRRENLTIVHEGKTYKAVFGTKQLILNQNDLQALRDFEMGIRSAMGGACTTIETYVIKFRSETLHFSDASCSHWFGKVLKTKLNF